MVAAGARAVLAIVLLLLVVAAVAQMLLQVPVQERWLHGPSLPL